MSTVNYFAAVEEFGNVVDSFNPQHADEWDNLHSSTKQNCSYIWAETLEELEHMFYSRCEYCNEYSPSKHEIHCITHNQDGSCTESKRYMCGCCHDTHFGEAWANELLAQDVLDNPENYGLI